MATAMEVRDTEVVAKATRRRFTAEYKRKVLQEAERAKAPGEVGALLRREGLYSSHLASWRAARERGELDLCAVMIDGIVFREHCVLLPLGIGSDGRKHALGLREGTTENAAVARALLAELIDRGLSTERPLLFVIDGAKALRKAIAETFGTAARVQRCQVHKLRNVLEHLPERMRPSVAKAMHQAWSASDAKLARRQLERLAASLEAMHPSAAASLREGLEETLTLQRLGIRDALYRTLRSTNAIENLNSAVASYTRNVKRWRGGRMILRWVGAALAEAQRGFRCIRGHDDLSKLVGALTRRRAELGQQKVA